MAIDHSQTYTTKSLRNFPHRVRLNAIISLLDGLCLSSNISYADFGCSNGYITDLIAKRYAIKCVYGFDCETDLLAIAAEKYPAIQFSLTDLNNPIADGTFDVVTCFETLEHVGKPDIALYKLLASCREGGRVIVTVPIETGPLGLLKFLAKVVIYRHRYQAEIDELFDNNSVGHYIWRLVRNMDISSVRDDRTRWGTHFGFDYRIIDRFLAREAIIHRSWRAGTTRFYVMEKQAARPSDQTQ